MNNNNVLAEKSLISFKEIRNDHEFYNLVDGFLTSQSVLHFRCFYEELYKNNINNNIDKKYFILFFTDPFLIYKRTGRFPSGSMMREYFSPKKTGKKMGGKRNFLEKFLEEILEEE